MFIRVKRIVRKEVIKLVWHYREFFSVALLSRNSRVRQLLDIALFDVFTCTFSSQLNIIGDIDRPADEPVRWRWSETTGRRHSKPATRYHLVTCVYLLKAEVVWVHFLNQLCLFWTWACHWVIFKAVSANNDSCNSYDTDMTCL